MEPPLQQESSGREEANASGAPGSIHASPHMFGGRKHMGPSRRLSLGNIDCAGYEGICAKYPVDSAEAEGDESMTPKVQMRCGWQGPRHSARHGVVGVPLKGNLKETSLQKVALYSFLPVGLVLCWNLKDEALRAGWTRTLHSGLNSPGWAKSALDNCPCTSHY